MKSTGIVSSLFSWISQIHKIVHATEGPVTPAWEVAAQTTCFFPSATTRAIPAIQVISSLTMRKNVTKLVFPGRPTNKL